MSKGQLLWEKIQLIAVKICWAIIQSCPKQIKFQTSSFPDLCPTDNADNCDVYIDRLNEILTNRQAVKEIAITAPYSGGKSSFLNTFVRINPQHEYTKALLNAIPKGGKERLKVPDIGEAGSI